MKNTISKPLAQLGFENDYIITELGFVLDTANQNQLVEQKNGKLYLKEKNGRRVYKSIKTLYKLAFGREYAEDNIESLPEEQWKPLDQKGKYHISSLGRVKSFRGNKAIILKPYKNQSGYCRVDIYLESRKTFLVHQLVAKAFVLNDDPETKDTIDHINGNKEDNSAKNLRWLSRADNVRAYHQNKKEGCANNENNS